MGVEKGFSYLKNNTPSYSWWARFNLYARKKKPGNFQDDSWPIARFDCLSRGQLTLDGRIDRRYELIQLQQMPQRINTRIFSVDSSHILLFAQEAIPILPSHNLLNGMLFAAANSCFVFRRYYRFSSTRKCGVTLHLAKDERRHYVF